MPGSVFTAAAAGCAMGAGGAVGATPAEDATGAGGAPDCGEVWLNTYMPTMRPRPMTANTKKRTVRITFYDSMSGRFPRKIIPFFQNQSLHILMRRARRPKPESSWRDAESQQRPVEQYAKSQRDELDQRQQSAQFKHVGMTKITIGVTDDEGGGLVGEEFSASGKGPHHADPQWIQAMRFGKLHQNRQRGGEHGNLARREEVVDEGSPIEHGHGDRRARQQRFQSAR